MQQQTLASMLSPLGMISPRTVRELDTTLDRLVSIKERNPRNTRVDPAIRAIGKIMCNAMLRDSQVAALANTPQPAAEELAELDFAYAA